jgi:hypothetical protein
VVYLTTLFAKYNQNYQVREYEMSRHIARIGEKRNSYKILVGKPEGKNTLGRPRRRWVNNIRMDLGEIE